IAAGMRLGQCPMFETGPSSPLSTSSPPSAAPPALHERDRLLEIPDRVRHRGGFLREPAIELETLRSEHPQRLAALTEQPAALLPCPHPRSPRGRTRKPRATATNRGFWALGAQVRDARARDRLIRPLASTSVSPPAGRVLLLWARLLPACGGRASRRNSA